MKPSSLEWRYQAFLVPLSKEQAKQTRRQFLYIGLAIIAISWILKLDPVLGTFILAFTVITAVVLVRKGYLRRKRTDKAMEQSEQAVRLARPSKQWDRAGRIHSFTREMEKRKVGKRYQ